MARKMSEGAVARDTLTTSQSAELVVFCAGAVQSVVRALVSAYELSSGNTIKLESGTAGAVAQRVAEGVAGDVIIVTAAGLAGLATAGKVEGTSIRDLGSLGVGMAVRAGAPKPDIHDVESFRSSLLAAQSIAYGDPVKGGQSGIHIAKVLAGLGIDKQLGSRLQIRDTGRDGFMDVAKGDIEIGLGPISEILANKDVALVGPFPAEIQSGVTFSAAVLTAAKNRRQAEEFVRHLTAPVARDKFEAMGFKVN